MRPGDLVFVDQFIDMTSNRKLTFYDGPKVVHISADGLDPADAEYVAKLGKGELVGRV